MVTAQGYVFEVLDMDGGQNRGDRVGLAVGRGRPMPRVRLLLHGSRQCAGAHLDTMHNSPAAMPAGPRVKTALLCASAPP